MAMTGGLPTDYLPAQNWLLLLCRGICNVRTPAAHGISMSLSVFVSTRKPSDYRKKRKEEGTILLESGLELSTFSLPSMAFWSPGYRSCHVNNSLTGTLLSCFFMREKLIVVLYNCNPSGTYWLKYLYLLTYNHIFLHVFIFFFSLYLNM